MTLICGRSTLKLLPCRRRVRAAPCYQHVGSRLVLPRRPRRQRANRQAGLFGWSPEAARRVLPGREVDGWRRTAEDQVRALIGDQEWERGRARMASASCQHLAYAAGRLLRWERYLRGRVDRTVEQVLDLARLPRLARHVTGALARRAPVPPLTQLGTAARAVRLLGVLTCAVQLVEPGNCPCLRDLVNEVREESARAVLDGAFAGLTPLRANDQWW